MTLHPPPLRLTQRARRATLVAAAGAAAPVALLFCLPPLFGLFLQGVDLLRSDLGLFCALRGAVSDSGSLFISTSLGSGGPLWARPEAEVLYPIRWLLLALGPDWATTLSPALHLAVGAAGAAWLARTFGIRPLASAAAGIAFACSGPALDLIRHAFYIAGAAYLPLAWASARRGLHPRGRGFHLLVAAAALSFLLLTGEAHAFAIGSALVALEIVARRPWSRRGVRRRASLLGLAVLASLLVGLSLWLPALGEMALSRRGGTLPPDEVMLWSFTPESWLGTLVRGALTLRVKPALQLWKVLYGADAQFPWNYEPYVGPLFLAAALAALLRRRTRTAAVTAAVGLLLALGRTTPIFALLLKLFPPLSLFRYPAKYLVVTTLAGSVLAAATLDALARSRRVRRAFAVGAGLLLAAVGAVAVWVHLHAPALDEQAAAMGRDLPTLAFLPSVAEAFAWPCIQAALPVAIALAATSFARGRKVVPLLLAADLAFSSFTVVDWGPPVAGVPSALAALVPSAGSRPVICHDGRMFGGAFMTDFGSLEAGVSLYRRHWAVTEFQACDGIVSAIPYSVLQTRMNRGLEHELDKDSVAAARALGCTHLVTRDFASLPRLVRPPGSTDSVEIALVPDPLPLAAIARWPRLLPNEGSLAAPLLSAPGSEQALQLIDDPLGRLPPGSLLPSGAQAETATVTWRSADRATLRLSGRGEAVAVVNTAFQAGWKARQGGHELPVLRAAGVILAVLVEDTSAGPVELAYRPPRLWAGLGACLAGLLLLAGLAAIFGRVARVSSAGAPER